MTQLKLTLAAYKALYGGGRVVVTEAALLDLLRPMAGEAFTLLLSDGSGALHVPGEAATGATLPVMGAPLGLSAFILMEDHGAVVREWGAELLLAKSHQPFDILLLRDAADAAARVGGFFHTLQNRLLMDLTARASNHERQTLYLRQASERLMLELTVARRVLDSIGFSDLSVVAEAPLGKGTVGPGAKLDTEHFSQILPADGLGIAALGLYVLAPKGKLKGGALRLALSRDADGKLLGEEILPYSTLRGGWMLVRFPEAVSNVFGDVRLDVTWMPTEKARGAAPRLGLSDIRGNRFGDDQTDRSLAVRIFKAVGRPTLAPESLELVPSSPAMPLVLLPGRAADALDFYGGAARLEAVTRDVGFGPYERSEAEGWVQMHLPSDRITGVSYRGPVPAKVERIELSVSVPDAGGPEVMFHAFLTASLDHVEARVARVLAGDAPAAHGFDHASLAVMPGAEKTLELVPENVTDTERSLVLVARALSGKRSGGWCRWLKAVFRVRPGANEDHILPELVPAASAGQPKRVIRTIKLPELGGMVQFIEGSERLTALTAEHGFSPMIMDENGGFLQTHPLIGRLSGAVLPSLVAPGTHQIVAQAHTGHGDAPDFIYGVFLVRHDISDIAGVIAPIMDGIELASGESARGADTVNGVHWLARRLKAQEEGRLELDFEAPLDTVYHLVLMAKPVGDVISFGWCRWTQLGIVSFEETHAQPAFGA